MDITFLTYVTLNCEQNGWRFADTISNVFSQKKINEFEFKFHRSQWVSSRLALQRWVNLSPGYLHIGLTLLTAKVPVEWKRTEWNDQSEILLKIEIQIS